MAGCVPKKADIVIIGGGIAGVSVAYWISEMQQHANNIVLLESRDQIAEGATGRNGGHLYPHPGSAFETGVIADIKNTVSKLKIDCDLVVNGTVDLARTEAELKLRQEIVDKQRAAGESNASQMLNADDVTRLLGFRLGIFAGGLLSKQAGRISTSRFTKRLAGVVMARGGVIRTRAAVRHVRRGADGAPHRVTVTLARSLHPGCDDAHSHTDFVIEAKIVVNACNALASRLSISPPTRLPRDFITPVRGQVAHAVSSDAKPIRHNFMVDESLTAYAISLPPSSPSPHSSWGNGGTSAGSSSGADLVIGGCRLHADGYELGVTDDSTMSHAVSGALLDELHYWTGAKWRFEQQWTGVMGFTKDERPVVDELEERLFILAGFNGHGVPTCFGAGKHTAARVLGLKPLSVPPEWALTEQRLKQGPYVQITSHL